MKLIVFGLAVSSSWGNGRATLWRGLSRGLSRHLVVLFARDVLVFLLFPAGMSDVDVGTPNGCREGNLLLQQHTKTAERPPIPAKLTVASR